MYRLEVCGIHSDMIVLCSQLFRYNTSNMSCTALSLMDTHCHFDFSVFDEERDKLWALCRANNIHHLLIPGVSPKQWQLNYGLTKSLKGVVCAAGVHPWWVDKLEKEDRCDDGLSPVLVRHLECALVREACVAVGECGLDKMIAADFECQKRVFEQHICMACELELPLIIHVRKTHNETLQLLARHKPASGGVIHGFTGSLEIAQQYWALGFYLGVGGSITYPRANKTRSAIAEMPLESLLLETDAPDMPLNGFQGEPNSPLKVIDVAKSLSELRGDDIDRIVEMTTNNAHILFNLPQT